MASGLLRDQILKQRIEAIQEARRQQEALLDLVGQEHLARLEEYVAAEVRALEWIDLWRSYDRHAD